MPCISLVMHFWLGVGFECCFVTKWQFEFFSPFLAFKQYPNLHIKPYRTKSTFSAHQSPIDLAFFQITGELQDRLSCWDALRAALPVGTVSGAPKVGTLCIISFSIN